MTFSELLRARAGSSHPAVITPDAVWSGEELMGRSAGAASWLDAIGAPPGRPVAALLSASASAYALVVAGATTRRPLAPLGARLTPDELVACVSGLAPAVLVAEPALARDAGAVADRAGCRLELVPAFEPSDRALDFEADAGDVAAILHTSGTSGLPKQVPYTQGPLAARVKVNAALLGFDAASVYASSSPLHHIAGLGMLCVALGAGATLLTFEGFSVANWQGLGSRGVTHALLVPSMIDILLEHDALALPGLRMLQYGGSPIHQDTLAAAMDALPGVQLLNIYGQTEGSPITRLGPDDHLLAAAGRPELLQSVGTAAPGVELRIEGAGPDGIGEVVARAAHFFKTDPDGWMRTGDLGRLDDSGYLYLCGRRGDKIIRGGENIYPVEVEEVIATHRSVKEVAVVGLPDRRWGEVVKAVVVPADPTSPPSPEDLTAHAREHLAGFKVPTIWEYTDALPRNQAGKVLRRVLATAAPTDP